MKCPRCFAELELANPVPGPIAGRYNPPSSYAACPCSIPVDVVPDPVAITEQDVLDGNVADEPEVEN